MNSEIITKNKPLIKLNEVLSNPGKYKKVPIIKGIINEGETMMLYGKSGSGKTFVATDFALSVACHFQLWCNCEIVNQSAKVLYFACESPEDIHERSIAWCQFHNKKDGDLLIDDEEMTYNLLESRLEELKDENLKLVFIDNISTSTLCEDENNSSAVARFCKRMALYARQYHLAIILVHHSGKDDKKDDAYRGSSAFYGNVNVVMQIKKNLNENKNSVAFCLMTYDKSRKKKPFESVAFDMFQQKVDLDGSIEEIGVVQNREIEETTELRNEQNKHMQDLKQFIEVFCESPYDFLTWNNYCESLIKKGYRKDKKDVYNKFRSLKDFFKANGITGKDKIFKITKNSTADKLIKEKQNAK